MADIAIRSRSDTLGALCDIHHIARSVLHQIGEDHRIAGYTQELRHHMSHLLDLRCRPHHHVCSPFEVEREVEGEGELIGEVMLEMVGQVIVQTVRAV